MNLYVKGTELEERLLHNNELYKQTIKLGGEINTLLLEREGSLEKSDKEALDLYRKQAFHFSLDGVELRLWQKLYFEDIQQPSSREIICVKGVK